MNGLYPRFNKLLPGGFISFSVIWGVFKLNDYLLAAESTTRR